MSNESDDASDPVLEDDVAAFSAITVDDALKAVEFGRFQALLLAYAGMSWIAEAMEMMLLSFVGPAVQREWGLSSTEESIITSVVFLGMMFGAYTWGVLSDLKGRRYGFFVPAVLTFCAGILSAFAPNYLALLLLRGFVGVGLSGGPVISSWFLEFIPAPNRGFWMGVISVFWTVGTVAEALLAWAIMPTLGWRWLLGFSSIPLLSLLVFYPLVPESPRYLVTKGETDKALRIMKMIAEMNRKKLPSGKLVFKLSKGANERDGDKELEDMSVQGMHLLQRKNSKFQQVSQGRFQSNRVINLFWMLLSPSMIKSTLLLWLVFFANAFTYYGLVLLTSQLTGAVNCNKAMETAVPNATSQNLYKDVLVTSIAEFPGLALAAVVVDRHGRRRSIGGFFLLCGVFLFPLLKQLHEKATIFLLFGARACITGSFTVAYIYAPELYPTRLRTTGLGTASSFARIGGILCPLVAVDLIKDCQQALAISLFVAVPVLASIAVFFLPVETTGQDLSDVIEDLNL